MSITQGRALDCSTNQCCGGGISKIYLANRVDVDIDNITRGVDNRVDSLPMVGAAVFYEYQVKEETASVSDSIAISGCCPIHTVGITFTFKCLKQEDLDLLKELSESCCGFVVIFEIPGGKRFIFGLETPRNAKFSEGSIETGTLLEDANEISVTLQAKQLVAMEELDPTLVIPV
jgi:hypothetical protein